ncbi:hypothetical protein QFC21_000886 [Naganishia friedmannii]|uniref:Uncharacterized protein n=1 Tax=Naganishia friedmannii TaxID=89922 RepID=A0ACC2W807_9TREE|nr:hypothetical protein QFC21_000886 [Naganishia friedmannii]
MFNCPIDGARQVLAFLAYYLGKQGQQSQGIALQSVLNFYTQAGSFVKPKWRWIDLDSQKRRASAVLGEWHLDIPIGDLKVWNTKAHYYISIKGSHTPLMELEMPFLESEVSTMELTSFAIAPEPASEKHPTELSTPAWRKRERNLKSLARESEKPPRSTAPHLGLDSDGSLPHLSQEWFDYLPMYPSLLRQLFGWSDFQQKDDESELEYSKPTGPEDCHRFESLEQPQFSKWEYDGSFETEYMGLSFRRTLDHSTVKKQA